ncbi:hypothetical protein ACOSQ2_032174 [Xanthoceras sorbifolium]
MCRAAVDGSIEHKNAMTMIQACLGRVWGRSDHRPVLLNISESTRVAAANTGCRRFFFEDWWAELPECQEIVQECWDGFSGRVWHVKELSDCLSKYAGNLSRWNREKFCMLRAVLLFNPSRGGHSCSHKSCWAAAFPYFSSFA